ncbi:MAG: hypothetical protein JRH20_09470 [Deltaproteobacteria bacterium]|nr:hypothetical protein [Deltaproteobacteria bacterium]
MSAAIYDHPAISQRYFFPQMGPPPSPLPSGSSLHIDAEGLAIQGYEHHPFPGAPTALYFHGNGERIADQLENWPAWAEAAGINMLFVDYPGYGASAGDPSLSSCRAAARGALAYLLARPSLEVPYVLVAGRSVGSIFALDVARQCPPERLGGLWLESAVADVGERLALRVPYESSGLDRDTVERAVARDFDHRQTLGELACPLSILHTLGDSLVSADNAERLASWSGEDVEVTWLEGDHNTIQWLNAARYPQMLRDWAGRSSAYMNANWPLQTPPVFTKLTK